MDGDVIEVGRTFWVLRLLRPDTLASRDAPPVDLAVTPVLAPDVEAELFGVRRGAFTGSLEALYLNNAPSLGGTGAGFRCAARAN